MVVSILLSSVSSLLRDPVDETYSSDTGERSTIQSTADPLVEREREGEQERSEWKRLWKMLWKMLWFWPDTRLSDRDNALFAVCCHA